MAAHEAISQTGIDFGDDDSKKTMLGSRKKLSNHSTNIGQPFFRP